MAYFANGSDGEYLQDQCDQCPLAFLPCPVLHVQMMFNYDQCKAGNEKLRDAMNCLIDESGKCLMRLQIIKVSHALPLDQCPKQTAQTKGESRGESP